MRDLVKQALTKLPRDLDEEDDEDDEPRFVIKEQMLKNAERLQQDRSTDDLGAAIEGAALDFYEKSDRERSAVLSTVRRHTKLLDYTAIKRVVAGHDFDLAELKTQSEGRHRLSLPAGEPHGPVQSVAPDLRQPAARRHGARRKPNR